LIVIVTPFSRAQLSPWRAILACAITIRLICFDRCHASMRKREGALPDFQLFFGICLPMRKEASPPRHHTFRVFPLLPPFYRRLLLRRAQTIDAPSEVSARRRSRRGHIRGVMLLLFCACFFRRHALLMPPHASMFTLLFY